MRHRFQVSRVGCREGQLSKGLLSICWAPDLGVIACLNTGSPQCGEGLVKTSAPCSQTCGIRMGVVAMFQLNFQEDVGLNENCENAGLLPKNIVLGGREEGGEMGS